MMLPPQVKPAPLVMFFNISLSFNPLNGNAQDMPPSHQHHALLQNILQVNGVNLNIHPTLFSLPLHQEMDS